MVNVHPSYVSVCVTIRGGCLPFACYHCVLWTSRWKERKGTFSSRTADLLHENAIVYTASSCQYILCVHLLVRQTSKLASLLHEERTIQKDSEQNCEHVHCTDMEGPELELESVLPYFSVHYTEMGGQYSFTRGHAGLYNICEIVNITNTM